MTRYKVSMQFTDYGEVFVEAESKEQAEEQAIELEHNGQVAHNGYDIECVVDKA